MADPAPENDPILNELLVRVKALALKKAKAMEFCDDETPEFDRGARALGMLLRTALLARQMNDHDTKKDHLNDADEETVSISDEQIRAFKRSIEGKLDRIEAQDCAVEGDRSGDSGVDCGAVSV